MFVKDQLIKQDIKCIILGDFFVLIVVGFYVQALFTALYITILHSCCDYCIFIQN